MSVMSLITGRGLIGTVVTSVSLTKRILGRERSIFIEGLRAFQNATVISTRYVVGGIHSSGGLDKEQRT